MPEKIRIVSCDYDGCFCHFGYVYATGAAKDIVLQNRVFNEAFQGNAESYASTTFIIGSNRQSKGIDDAGKIANAATGSCFESLKALSEHHKATFSPFLMADLYGDLPDGESFIRATDPSYQGANADCIVDTSKVILLYAQMHKFANENPDKYITFDFYDDRRDILQGLSIFFEVHPKLIPQNINLRLTGYNGATLFSIGTLRGHGFIDSNYKQTVIEMTKMAEEPRPVFIPAHVLMPVNGARNVYPEKLTKPIPLMVDLSYMDSIELSGSGSTAEGAEASSAVQVPFKLERQLSVTYTGDASFFGQSSALRREDESDLGHSNSLNNSGG